MERIARGALALVLGLAAVAHAEEPKEKKSRGIVQHVDPTIEPGAGGPPPVKPVEVYREATRKLEKIAKDIANEPLGEHAPPSRKERILAYDAYAEKAIEEAGVANTNRSNKWPWTKSESPIRALRPVEYEQAKESVALLRQVAERSKDPTLLESAERMERWLAEGWLLADDSLPGGVHAETRRDGSQKSTTTIQWVAERMPGDGNVYLNAGGDLMFDTPAGREAQAREVAALEASIARLERSTAELGRARSRTKDQEKQLASERARLELQRLKLAEAKLLASPRVSLAWRAAILAHEERHTRQGFAREGPGYALQLRFLEALRDQTTDVTERARIEHLIEVTKTDTHENAH